MIGVPVVTCECVIDLNMKELFWYNGNILYLDVG